MLLGFGLCSNAKRVRQCESGSPVYDNWEQGCLLACLSVPVCTLGQTDVRSVQPALRDACEPDAPEAGWSMAGLSVRGDGHWASN